VNKATTHRFGPCVLDEARRSLTVNGLEIPVQPKVFDLLAYLVRHRDRAVPKQELLDALWPGTLVVDNALQRAVSLARAALAQAGLEDAVRTYARHGYRFVFDDAAASAPGDAREAIARLDWAAACEAFAAADLRQPLPPEELEQWGRAAICAGLGNGALAALERAVAQQDAAGDRLGAARATLLLVQIRLDGRQGAIARGLLHRAARYLEGHPDTAERGHYAWIAARVAVSEGDAESTFALGDEAARLGRALRDPDVECLGLVYRGHGLLAKGASAEGFASHEEAAAMIRVGGMSPWAAGWALCSILYAARYRCDWVRAAQFADAFSEWSRECRMPAFPGTCQLHRAAVLGVRGELERAATEVRAAVTLLATSAPWAEGDAYCVLGDIQLGLGDFEGAEASFRQAHALGWDPQPGLARLHLWTGRAETAQRGLERALDVADWSLLERRGELLCLLVVAATAAGDVPRAREALRTVASNPEQIATEAHRAMYCVAEAEIALVDSDLALAARKLREGVRHWREVGCPVGEAEARLRLAECLLRDGDVAGCELELHTVESGLASAAVPHRARVERLKRALDEAR
jgi:DNA-binding winged helix-turn-helix (wHTH) protein